VVSSPLASTAYMYGTPCSDVTRSKYEHHLLFNPVAVSILIFGINGRGTNATTIKDKGTKGTPA